MQLYRWVERKLMRWGVPADSSDLATSVTLLATVLLLAVLSNYLTRRFIATSAAALARRTEARWDDLLAERRVLEPLSHLASGIVFFTLLPLVFPHIDDATDVIRRGSLVYMVAVTSLVAERLLSALVDLYNEVDMSRQRPIKSYAQLLKIINYIVSALLLVSISLGQSPLVLLGGLGALSAVLILVFKDPLLGLVASVQLSANDMIRKGDAVEVPKHGIEGEVVDLSLTTIKIQAADKSIATLPNYALVSDSFRNLRGIREAGVRRLKRALKVDVHSVCFLSEARLAQLAAHPEVALRLPDLGSRFAFQQVTNLGVFRAYVEACARHHPKVERDMQLLARQLPPSEHGVAVELQCYVRELDYGAYEAVQAELFEHLIAMVSVFELRLFQLPTRFEVAVLADSDEAHRPRPDGPLALSPQVRETA